jgi:Carboxypeptidase regulatory-like domain/Putative zinc-finger
MSEVLQSGLHPDADQLSAFVEQALPAGERELTLAHLAVCPRCRAVIALSLPPADEPVLPLRELARGRWFTGWNLVWSAALSVSAAAFFAIYIYRAATPRSAPARMAVAQPSPSPATPVRPPEPATARSANPEPVRALGNTQPNNAVAATSMNSALADKPRTIEPAIVTGRDAVELIAPAAAPNQFMSYADKSAAMAKKAEAKQTAPSASFGVAGMEGPSGAPAQIQRSSGGLPSDRKVFADTEAALKAKAAAPSAAAMPRPAAPATANETIAVTSAPPVVNEPSATTVVTALPDEPVLQLQRQEHPLPSHLPVVSMVARERLVLAIDAHNTVFLSGNAGKRWRVVQTPWSGRAVRAELVSSESAREARSGAMQADAKGALRSGKPSFAGQAGGSLSGRVTDATGAVIPGATVVVVNSVNRAARAVKTDSTGRFLVDGLAPGAYDVKASSPGFKTQQLTGVTVAALEASVANLSLSIGAVSQSVTVASAAGPRDRLSAAAKPSPQTPAPGNAPALFEVTTDSGERWTSSDGLTWTRQ